MDCVLFSNLLDLMYYWPSTDRKIRTLDRAAIVLEKEWERERKNDNNCTYAARVTGGRQSHYYETIDLTTPICVHCIVFGANTNVFPRLIHDDKKNLPAVTTAIEKNHFSSDRKRKIKKKTLTTWNSDLSVPTWH